MPTDLKRFTEAYATMTVAVYEPLIINWISLLGVRFISNEVASRLPKATAVNFDRSTPAALALGTTIRKPIPQKVDVPFSSPPLRVPLNIHGQAVNPGFITPLTVPGYPNAVAVGNDIYLDGFTAADSTYLQAPQAGSFFGKEDPMGLSAGSAAPQSGAVAQGLKKIPMIVSSRLGTAIADFDFHKTRDELQQNLVEAARLWAKAPESADLFQLMLGATSASGVTLPHLWPGEESIHQALSPIGVAHYYRQLYFHKEEGLGPIEEAFTIAPLETLEIVYQTVRKQIHEEILEKGLEVVSDSAVESKNLDEVSDKVSSMVQHDTSASMSANVSGSIGVWQLGVSATASVGISSERSREFSSRRLKEVTRRASERITKSFSIKTRDVTDVTTTSMTRRVIRNDSTVPVSYGLRRLLRRVNVKVQDLGPKLVWQLYLRNPGRGLSRSSFVHFRASGRIFHNESDLPPGAPPKPTGGLETESTATSVRIRYVRTFIQVHYVTIVVKTGPDRVIKGVRIDRIMDLGGGRKDDVSPAPLNQYDLGSTWDESTRTFTADIAIAPGDSSSVQVTFTYTWEPSSTALLAWEHKKQAALVAAGEEEYERQFQRRKATITECSKVKSRPANDLRQEERYEVMNRMISYLFGRGDDLAEPSPLEIELFHRYFDIDAMFTYTHPSWWKPRFTSSNMDDERESYNITAESEPAPFGSSLGWLMQLDGDRRRNEFLNSPWARICLPIRPGREQETVEWLSKNMEGEVGYDRSRGPLATLLTEIRNFREKEQKLGGAGPDFVTVHSTPGAPADPAKPEGVYPVVDEFDVTVPTDGFVYDELRVVSG